MLSTLTSTRVLLAWTDTTGGSDVSLRAVADGETLLLDSPLAAAFTNAAGALPWLDDRSDLRLPMCAYAVIAETDAGHRIRSGFALYPNADDVARLNLEFRMISTALAGPTAAPLFTVLRARSSHDLRVSLYAGTATRDGYDVALSDREFNVLATLALARRKLGREELCDRVWPDRDLEAAARLLKVYVHRIRTRFGTTSVIDTRGGGYHIGEGVVVDVDTVETILRAANPSGRLLDVEQRRLLQRTLDGISDQGYRRLEALENFAEIECRFLTAASACARTLVDDALADEDGARALAIAAEFASLNPSEEDAAELLIRTQLRLGRRDEASCTFRAFCRSLRDELDLPPPPHLSSLLQA
jgi:DNA-binding SARP family transcriptional activator